MLGERNQADGEPLSDARASGRLATGVMHSGLVEGVTRISHSHLGLFESEIATHNIRAQHQRHTFVMGNPARQTLTPEAAVGGNDEAFRRHVFQGMANSGRDLLRRLDRSAGVIDHADTNLLVGFVMFEQRNIARLIETADQLWLTVGSKPVITPQAPVKK